MRVIYIVQYTTWDSDIPRNLAYYSSEFDAEQYVLKLKRILLAYKKHYRKANKDSFCYKFNYFESAWYIEMELR